jgi:hypothetical protein
MTALETKIAESAASVLNSHAERLARCGMTWRGPEIEIWRSEPESYTSEFRLTILKEGEINDVLEFHIYDEGRALLTADEVRNWLDEQLEALERLQT